MCDLFIKDRHLHRKLATGVERERATVKDLIVLTAHHVEVDQRQASFDNTADHLVHAYIKFAAIIGGAIGHEQEFSACFFQRFRHVLVPCIFANGAADAGVSNGIRAAQRTAVKDADLIEHILIGEVMFECLARDLATATDKVGVVELAIFNRRSTNRQSGAVSALHRQLFDRGEAGRLHGWLHHQVLRVVA